MKDTSKISKAMKGNKNTLGKHWKIRNTSKMGNRTGRQPALGKHWKVKDTSRMNKDKIGISLSEEHKRNLKKAYKKEKNYFWKGGISFEPYSVDWTTDLKRAIRKRDRYTCQVCGKEPSIIVHHIDYNKKNCNSDNLVILCARCHAETNSNRKYWINYFNNLKT